MVVMPCEHTRTLTDVVACKSQNYNLTLTHACAYFYCLHCVVSILSGDKYVCVSIRADGTVGLLTICFGDISGQSVTINVDSNHV